jgi:hypothetical protein
MPGKLTVVIAQSNSRNPAHRAMEEKLAVELIGSGEFDVSLVPHLYDMRHDHTGILFLRNLPGDVVVLAWLYPRATRWVLDRAGVKGNTGVSLLDRVAEEDEDEPPAEPEEPKNRLGALNPPNRKIWCLDLRDHASADVYLTELRRIKAEESIQTVDLLDWIKGKPDAAKLERYLNPPGLLPILGSAAAPAEISQETGSAEKVSRRWYPVIDYDRCTNCMECIDFCLFGVYGVDEHARILVEQQDNCKKGCPACSRVCPENAILFPEYKSAAIAGAPVASAGGLKIDLSKLFGGDDGASAFDQAIAERDRELVADGRTAVGATVGIPKRQLGLALKPKDELDSLLDALDI